MTSIAQKLQLKPDQPLALVNPPSGYQDYLTGEMPANPLITLEGSQPVNALLFFVNNLEEALNLTPIAIQHIDQDGLLWLAYPKGSSKQMKLRILLPGLQRNSRERSACWIRAGRLAIPNT